jgi:hypothetical protein
MSLPFALVFGWLGPGLVKRRAHARDLLLDRQTATVLRRSVWLHRRAVATGALVLFPVGSLGAEPAHEDEGDSYSVSSAISSALPRFSTSQKSGYSLTITSRSRARCPGATAKRSGRERSSSQCSGESRNRAPQCSVTHSQRNPAVGRPCLIQSALRSLRSRHSASLYARRSSRDPKTAFDQCTTKA